jgi:hypothetical protein
MLDISINLGVKYSKDAPHCKIICNGTVLHNSQLTKNKVFNFLTDGPDVDISIKKTGLYKDNHQHIAVEGIQVNGVQMDVSNFGKFFVEWNTGINNHWLKTTKCDYNGTWHFNIKCPYSLVGFDNLKNDEIKHQFEDCDIACFGDSSTYGQFLQEQQTWPYVVGTKTGLHVRNYGVYSQTGASNFNQIFAITKQFLLQNKAKHILIMLPPAYKKQILIDGKIVNAGRWHPDTYDYFLNNEAHHLCLLISQIEDFVKKYCNGIDINFATSYHRDYNVFSTSKIGKLFVDFVDPEKYTTIGGVRHHYDHTFCLALAENFYKVIKNV